MSDARGLLFGLHRDRDLVDREDAPTPQPRGRREIGPNIGRGSGRRNRRRCTRFQARGGHGGKLARPPAAPEREDGKPSTPKQQRDFEVLVRRTFLGAPFVIAALSVLRPLPDAPDHLLL